MKNIEKHLIWWRLLYIFVRFAAAHRDFTMMDGDTMDFRDMTQREFNPTPAVFTDDDVHDQIEISKELFLVAAWPKKKA